LFREKYDALHQKYHEICIEKKKHLSDLEKAYDQIEKLNAVLMGKETDISILKINEEKLRTKIAQEETRKMYKDKAQMNYSPSRRLEE
jgi:hypothetical protein